MVPAEYGQCFSIFSVVSPFCLTWEGQRHLFFHVGTTGGSSRFTASLLIQSDMRLTKTHTDILYATGLGSTQKDYSVTWWPLRMVTACNLLPFLWAIPSFIWSGVGVGSGSSSITKVQLLPAISWRDWGKEGETERGSGSDEFQSE